MTEDLFIILIAIIGTILMVGLAYFFTKIMINTLRYSQMKNKK
jgi:hypothetical protein